jgi:hypothetical protein
LRFKDAGTEELKENVQVEKAPSDGFVYEESKNEAEDNTKQSQKET